MSKIATPPGQSAARDVLSQTDAAARALRVSDVSYSIRLDLVAGQETYHGDVTIHFAATGEEPLFLDFRGRHISRLMLNGGSIEPDWTGYRLTLPGEHLRATNELRIEYENDYDTTGDGLHRFVDPEDGSEYVYTNFEPYEAHRLFPCFDQPDLKATYEFNVAAPSTWRVISNAPLAASSPAEAGRTIFSFARTEVFSTYLTALVGGPYVERHVEHGGLHLALYARRSMERYLDEQAAEILEITGQGMDFFARLFDQPYPFAKYDQVFVPEYNAGAMENVGCVTYNEAYLFRDNATDQQRLDRGETFLHELAHMWFGNLVTMRWWDDLWLNESFATYISYLALTEATRFGDGAWKVFNSDIKRWAYQQDQLPTTHPISGTAADTEIAFLNFDGITYGKGASVLKQLVKHIGRDVFERGMQLYFRRHGWGNATLADFLRCLEDAGNISLAEWARVWLQTASVNTLAASVDSRDGRIASLAIEQTAPAAHDVFAPTRSRLLSTRARWRNRDRCSRGVHRRSENGGFGRCGTPTAGVCLPQPWRPRLRQGRARRPQPGLRPRQPRPRRRSAVAQPVVGVAVGDGARPAPALARVPGHRASAASVGVGFRHPRDRARSSRLDDQPLSARVALRCRGPRLVRARHGEPGELTCR